MQVAIHPQTYTAKIVCNCGATYNIGNTTLPVIHVEICGACHPLYTGKQKFVDTAGRVDKFLAKQKAAGSEE